MAYKFNQFRREQYDNYLTDKSYSQSTVNTVFEAYRAYTFKDQVINADFSAFETDGISKRSYYIKFDIQRFVASTAYITIKLINTTKTFDNEQYVTMITLKPGNELASFDLVISPNANYNQLKFEINRDTTDFEDNHGSYYGRVLTLSVVQFAEITDIIKNVLNPSIENTGRLKQIGVQSAPGLEMCIDGQLIKVGRTGIYEINYGININSIGFIVNKNDGQHFIMDYQY